MSGAANTKLRPEDVRCHQLGRYLQTAVNQHQRFRQLKNDDWTNFDQDLKQSKLFSNPAENVDEFADQIDAVTVRLLDHYCPLRERKRFMSIRRDNRWLSQSDRVIRCNKAMFEMSRFKGWQSERVPSWA